MPILEGLLEITINSVLQFLYLFGILIAVGLVLGVMERYASKFIISAWSYKGILATAWIGVPIHEFGHAVMCVIFGHRITKMKLIQFKDPDGVLGYVEHQYRRGNLYHRIGTFFIGIAPVFSGVVAIIVSMYFLLPNAYELFMDSVLQNSENGLGIGTLFVSCLSLFKAVFSVGNIMNPLFWVFLFLAFCISSHIALSRADMKECYEGIYVMLLILFLINLFLGSGDYPDSTKGYNSYIVSFGSIAIFFSAMRLGLSFILYQFKIKKRNRLKRFG